MLKWRQAPSSERTCIREEEEEEEEEEKEKEKEEEEEEEKRIHENLET